MKVGVLISRINESVEEKFKKAAELGFKSCQISSWDKAMQTDEMAERVISLSKKYGIEISGFWCGWSGPAKWNFTEGPVTLGLVPKEYRTERIAELKFGADFAKKIGIKNVITHVGFLPENYSDPEFPAVVEAIREVALHCKENGQYFLFETGQETPVTLLRIIEEVGTGNLGINLDPANLVMYGKANPVDALDVFGKYVMDVHAKDGKYPTEGKNLGPEVPLGEGKVNFPRLIARLRELGYDGPLTIEREISGDEQIRDIIAGKKLLDKIIEESI